MIERRASFEQLLHLSTNDSNEGGDSEKDGKEGAEKRLDQTVSSPKHLTFFRPIIGQSAAAAATIPVTKALAPTKADIVMNVDGHFDFE